MSFSNLFFEFAVEFQALDAEPGSIEKVSARLAE
jgi:hypothetical protein